MKRVQIPLPPELRQAQIEQIESRQARAVRELTLDPNNQQARERLAQLDEQIKALRG